MKAPRPVPCFVVTTSFNGASQSSSDLVTPGVDECPRGTSTRYAVPLFAFYRSAVSDLPVEERSRAVMEWAKRLSR